MVVSIGDKAPSFSLFDQDRKLRSLYEFCSKSKVVLAFFPGAFTSTCTREMCSFRDSVAKLSRLNAQVVGISVNDPFTLKGFAERNSLNFPLLSDYRRTAITEYGVQLPDFAGLKGYTVAQRSIFIIDRDEKVRFSWVAADPSIEPDYKLVEEELRKIE